MIPFRCFGCGLRWSLDEESAAEVRECPECGLSTLPKYRRRPTATRSSSPSRRVRQVERFTMNNMSSGPYLNLWAAVVYTGLRFFVIPCSLFAAGRLITNSLVPR